MTAADSPDAPTDNTKSRAIAILGMHRSGTSALAGSLRQAGVDLGKVLDDGFARNPKGLQEPPALLYMHEDLLRANGGSWHEPPAAIEWKPMHLAVRDLFIESRQGRPLWGFKDPRTLLVLDGWRAVLPDLEFTGIFRHPALVASSSHSRNGFPVAKCCAIWTRYNRHLLALHEQRAFPLVEFVSEPAAMERAVGRVLSGLRLAPPAAPDFLDTSLRSFEAYTSGLELPEEAAAVYRRLQERAPDDA
jgi:hypothetical protein